MSDTDISVTDTRYQGFLLGGPRTDILMGILSQRVDEKESTARRLVHTSQITPALSLVFLTESAEVIRCSGRLTGKPRTQLGRVFRSGHTGTSREPVLLMGIM
jgi:hypothetical protein